MLDLAIPSNLLGKTENKEELEQLEKKMHQYRSILKQGSSLTISQVRVIVAFFRLKRQEGFEMQEFKKSAKKRKPKSDESPQHQTLDLF